MGKRKRHYSESDSDLDDYIKKKVKKFLKKKKDRRRRHKSPASPTNSVSASEHEGGTSSNEANQNADAEHSNTRVTDEPLPSTSTAPPASEVLEKTTVPAEPDISEPTDSALNSELLSILGEDPSIVTEYGKEIQGDLAIRFQHIITNGLSKESRKELQDKYLPPSNCPVIDAPALNAEIKAAVSEAVLKRDRGIELKQKQLGRAISCLGEALTLLMSKEEKDVAIIKLLMDASRLMCDCQNSDSITRRNFVLFNVKKEIKDQLQKTKIDKYLFGSDLPETLKTAKLISKSGAELKSTPLATSKSFTKNKSAPDASTQQPRNNLNWKAPPQSRRQKGTQRTKEPAARSQHASSSRPLQRAHQSSRSRR